MKNVITRGFAAIASALAMVGPALAEVPLDVTTAITATKTDSTAVAVLMIGVTAALLVFKYIRRLMK